MSRATPRNDEHGLIPARESAKIREIRVIRGLLFRGDYEPSAIERSVPKSLDREAGEFLHLILLDGFLSAYPLWPRDIDLGLRNKWEG